MKVLMVSTVAETLRAFILPFASHFRAEGWQVDGMANGVSACEDCRAAFHTLYEIEWSRSPLDGRNLLAAPALIRELVAREGYDLVHVHTPVAAFVTRYALRDLRRQCGLKVIYTAHGFHFYRGGPWAKNLLFLTLEKLAGRWTDYLVVINREDERAAKRHWLVPPERVRYMPGIGIDTSLFRRENVSRKQVASIQRELLVSDSCKLFLMVAEFNQNKRHADALRAFAKVQDIETCLAFAGAGSLLGGSREFAERLGLLSRVRFLGYRDDIPALLAASTGLVLPSAREGLPRSVMEAMCMQVPVVGTRIRGVRDLLEGGGGLTVDVGDVDGLAGAMTWLAENPDEAKTMGQRGYEQVADYDLGNIINLHEDLYCEAVLCQ